MKKALKKMKQIAGGETPPAAVESLQYKKKAKKKKRKMSASMRAMRPSSGNPGSSINNTFGTSKFAPRGDFTTSKMAKTKKGKKYKATKATKPGDLFNAFKAKNAKK